MSSAQRRFTRGTEQVAELVGEVQRDVERDRAYTFEFEFGDWSDGGTPCTVYATESKPPDASWSLRAGEALQNLRASLDHAVWAAWQAANTGDGNHTAFPIAETPEKFVDARGRLRGLPTEVCAAIERVQPYNKFPEAPAEDALAVLARLSNTDNHRTLATVSGWVGTAAIGHNLESPAIEGWTHGTFTALGPGRNEVGSFFIRGETPATHRDATPMYAYEVHLEGRPFDYLRGIVRRVFEVLYELEEGEQPGFNAPYPMIMPAAA